MKLNIYKGFRGFPSENLPTKLKVPAAKEVY